MKKILYLINPNLKVKLTEEQFNDLIFDFTNKGNDVKFKKTEKNLVTSIKYFDSQKNELHFEVII